MPKKLDYQLSNDELQEIEQTISQSHAVRTVRRATGIRLLHLGHEPGEVAAMLMVNVGSVYNWHKRFRAEGISGLADQPRSGRPRKADDTYCRELEEALEKPPAPDNSHICIEATRRGRGRLYAFVRRQQASATSAGKRPPARLKYVCDRPP